MFPGLHGDGIVDMRIARSGARFNVAIVWLPAVVPQIILAGFVDTKLGSVIPKYTDTKEDWYRTLCCTIE